MFFLLTTLLVNLPFDRFKINVLPENNGVQENLISQVNHTNHLHVINYCDASVLMFIRYKDLFFDWNTVVFSAPPGFSEFVYNEDNGVYIESKNSFFYVFAVTANKSHYWSGDHILFVNGKRIPFQERFLRRVNAFPPHWDLEFSCP